MSRWWLLLLACGVGLPLVAWSYLTMPEVFRYAVSPDGSWSAAVIRQQTSLFEGVDVSLIVRDRSGLMLWQRLIDTPDLWQDVETR
jgi:hypothetical protein